MKRNEKTIAIISVLLIILAAVILFIPNISSTLKTIPQIGLLVLFALIANIFLKPTKVNRNYAKTATKSVLIVLVAALIVGFNLGLVVGLARTMFPPTLNTILNGILPTVGMIVASELLRKVLVSSAYDNKLLLAFITIALILAGIAVELRLSDFRAIDTAFVAICVTIVPITAEGLLSTYMMKRAGMMPTLTYRLVRGLYVYLLPVAPVFSQYLFSVTWVLVPFFIYRLVKHDLPDEVIKHGGKIEKSKSSFRRNFSIITVPVVALLATLIVLISGIFRFKMIAVATGSMAPTFDRGDAVIYDKEAELDVGDVMAFSHDGKIITHRIVKIGENGKKKIYYTKGDANNTMDSHGVESSSVLGKVSLVVKYIGLPTVWFNETIGNL